MYLGKHLYGNAKTQDLWDALKEVNTFSLTICNCACFYTCSYLIDLILGALIFSLNHNP